MAIRLFRRMGLDVQVARNITDVDDLLVAQARRQKISWRSMAVQQTYRFEDDVARLGVLTPTFEPQAHNHVEAPLGLVRIFRGHSGSAERARRRRRRLPHP